MPQLQLAAGMGSGDLFVLLVVAFVWAIAVALDRAEPASPSRRDEATAALAWENPADPDTGHMVSRDAPSGIAAGAPEDLAA